MSSSMQGATGMRDVSAPKAPKGYTTAQNYTPAAMDLYASQFNNVGEGSYLSRLAAGDEGIFNQIEAPAMRQFSELQGQNASRFSGMGMGARRGSGFNNMQSQATSDFAQDLQSRRQSLQQQAIKDLMGMSNDLLQQKPYSLIEKQKPWWQTMLTKFGNSAAESAGKNLFGGGGGGGGDDNSSYAMASKLAMMGG